MNKKVPGPNWSFYDLIHYLFFLTASHFVSSLRVQFAVQYPGKGKEHALYSIQESFDEYGHCKALSSWLLLPELSCDT